VLQVETGPPERVHVIGPLTGAALRRLLDVVRRAEVLLDLSQVSQVDTDAVRVLTRLGAGLCEKLACPRWLARGVERHRRCWPTAPVAGNLF
jgi:hypothetical protein